MVTTGIGNNKEVYEMKKIEIVRGAKGGIYLMIKLSFNELDQLGKDIEVLKMILEEKKK